MNNYPSSVFDMPGLLSQELQCSCEQAQLLLMGLTQMVVQNIDPMLRRIQEGVAQATLQPAPVPVSPAALLELACGRVPHLPQGDWMRLLSFAFKDPEVVRSLYRWVCRELMPGQYEAEFSGFSFLQDEEPPILPEQVNLPR